MTYKNKKTFSTCFLLSAFCFLFFSFSFVGATTIGEKEDFYIDASYDVSSRTEIETVLKKIGDNSYIYIDDSWWNELEGLERDEIKESISNLAEEFDEKIYPTLTSNFGSEWKPGIDDDDRITILLHPMKKTRAGYFRTNDEYSEFQVTDSNEREMVYLNADMVLEPTINALLAHEFSHLITFNQKDKLKDKEEPVWLNEARAEYVPTLCGYNSEYQDSYLKTRVQDFLNNPSDSLTEWNGFASDYGALSLFIHYLVDHYGVEILRDSLQSPKTGISSLDYALGENGFEEDFSEVFTNWTVAIAENNCSLGEKFCYKEENLKKIKVTSQTDILSSSGNNTISTRFFLKNWSALWYRIYGGDGDLIVEFDGDPNINFGAPYLICDKSNACQVEFLELNEFKHGEFVVNNFGKEYKSVTIIPSVQHPYQTTVSYLFTITVKSQAEESGEQTTPQPPKQTEKEKAQQIEELKVLVANLQAQIDTILKKPSNSSQGFRNNLYFGMMQNPEVRYLQEFLENQGPEIYPEGLVTGNFLSLTRTAVIRFQEKYTKEILKPLGLTKGTGFVGPMTRAKINQLFDSRSSL